MRAATIGCHVELNRDRRTLEYSPSSRSATPTADTFGISPQNDTLSGMPMRCARSSSSSLVCAARPAARSGDSASGTINQGSTLPELQYQQVLDNLAQFADQPVRPALARQPQGRDLPGHRLALRRCGAGPRPAGHLVPAAPSARGPSSPSGGCRRSSTPTELHLLRIAYRRAHGFPTCRRPSSSTSWPTS